MSVKSEHEAASKVCELSNRFSTWALGVSAVYPPRQDTQVLEGLTDMVSQSTKLPNWLFDQDSELHQIFKSLYPDQMLNLSQTPYNMVNDEQPDEATSKDLVHALHHIVYIMKRHLVLVNHAHHGKHSKSDLRQPLERLASHVWDTDIEADLGYLFRSDCAVKLPNTLPPRIADFTVDSAVFVFNPGKKDSMTVLPEKVQAGLTCTVEDIPYLELVHWVMEYNRSDMDEVQRQIYYGMVSSLWQRRALGRMNDFVFGTAHAAFTITVYAARWEKRDLERSSAAVANILPLESPKDTADPKTVVEAAHNAVEKRPRSDSTGRRPQSKEESAGKGDSKETPSIVQTPQEKEYQIIVYEIARYRTSNMNHMVEYYLLMRGSRKLADQYRKEVFQDTVRQLMHKITDPSRYDWPAPRDDHGTNRSGLGSVLEKPNHGGDHQDTYVAEPREEARWMAEWDLERRTAMEKYGYGSLKDFSINSPEPELDIGERISNYLGSL